MNIFIARQPIFDNKMNVFAYEILYRSENSLNANIIDGDLATSEVVLNSLMMIGTDKIAAGNKAFINFTKKTINSDLPKLFSNKNLVIEILEDVIPDEEFIENCKILKNAGYKLALDDFEISYKYDDIINIVDIIKVDFILTSVSEREKIIKKYKNSGISFLAEKIETVEEYNEAINMGYDYFQGYFFSRPVIISGSDVRTFSSTYTLVLKELNDCNPEFSRLEKIIEKDMAMAYKLLRLINSPAFYSRNKIASIKHALTMLGFKELKKWISLLMIRELGKDKPNELIRVCLIRAKMCELIAKKTELKKRASEAFLMGLFSLVDVLLERKLDEIIEELPLFDDVKNALLGEENIFKNILDIIIYYEKGKWDEFELKLEKIDVLDSFVSSAYLQSIEWIVSFEIEN